MTPLDTPPLAPKTSFSLLSLHQGRFTRLSYIAWQLLLKLVFFIGNAFFLTGAGLFGLLSFSTEVSPQFFEQILPGLSNWVFFGLIVLYSYFSIVIDIRRLHDCNCSGWWALLSLIPLINFVFLLILIFMPGSKTTNTYGLPRPTPTFEKFIAWLGLLLSILAMTSLAIFIFAFIQASGGVMPQSLPEVSEYF